ncbi:EAL domain-containing protein [Planosporangium flavigriseum]|nr:EAL domain-containing protein [Planosporangium flavigriseum]
MSPPEAARLVASGDLDAGHVVVAAPELDTATTALAQLAMAGFNGASSVLLTGTGAVQNARTLQQLQVAIDNIPAPIFSKDADGVYGACNRAFETFVGVPREKIIGRTVHDLWSSDLAAMYDKADRALMEAGGTQIYDGQVRYADGSVRDVTFYKAVFTDDQGTARGQSGAILDITERRALEAKLRTLADSDPLTGAANRASFARRLDEAAAHADTDQPPAVLLIDLDDFKIVNDTLGHDIGDKLLVAVSELLRQNVRELGLVARLGGDEFAVLTENLRADDVDLLVQRILAALTPPVLAADHPLVVRASIGVAYGRPGDRGADLLRNADIALYVAKDSGKGQYAYYRSGMKTRVVEQATLLNGLRQALNERQLHLEYQPIVRLSDGAVIGVEALARWRDPTRGVVPPARFIPIAERSGLILPLGRWVLDQACRDASRWQRLDPVREQFTMHVNVSAHQLREPTFTADLHKALTDAGLNPAALVIELTETAMTDDPATVETVHAIRELGVRIALDDFGTGQSSLAILASCPVDVIKIDKSFVDQITGSDRHAAVARTVVQLANSLGMETVAEGVESAVQARHLHTMGYRQAQGFHFARPLVPDAVDLLLE